MSKPEAHPEISVAEALLGAPLEGDTAPRTWRDVVRLCREPHHLRTTLTLAVVVGTALFAINQLDVLIKGRADAGTAVKIVLTYLVPFLVSNYGIVHATRRHHRDGAARVMPPSDQDPG
ncbi:MAG: hypothetical protein NVSMB29_04390 [Candidatus Dormibacteria bacterium]